MTIHPFPKSRRRIAVIGSGISGLGAAWALRDTADVQLFEKRGRLGGHSCTVDIDYDGVTIPLDVGFIVYTPRCYPNLEAFFDHLGVERRATTMSFGYSEESGIEWCSNLLGFAAQKRNMIRPAHLGMIGEMVRFCLTARKDLAAGQADNLRLRDYLARKRYSQAFQERFLLPMAAAIWSASENEMMDQDARAFLEFYAAHGLTDFTRPQWRTVAGGSRSYVKRIADDLAGCIHTSAGVESIERGPGGVRLFFEDGAFQAFDEVILACHSDQALSLLYDPSPEERDYLGAIPFRKNRVVLHRDPALAPSRRRAIASWNSRRAPGDELAYVTYDMNQLQHIDPSRPIYVTLNPTREPDPDLTFAEYEFDHPSVSSAAMAAKRRFNRIQGVNRTWFAGAWLGYGFHEDGLTSGLRAALKLGGTIPWDFAEGAFSGGGEPEESADALAARYAAQ